jgi:hypothetical protein
MTFLRIGLVLALAVAAAIVANVVLLGIASGSNEPVGNLRFSTVVSSTPVAPPAPPATTPVSHDNGRAEPDDD